MGRLGRNSLCICGSGLKYKRCCLLKKEQEELNKVSNCILKMVRGAGKAFGINDRDLIDLAVYAWNVSALNPSFANYKLIPRPPGKQFEKEDEFVECFLELFNRKSMDYSEDRRMIHRIITIDKNQFEVASVDVDRNPLIARAFFQYLFAYEAAAKCSCGSDLSYKFCCLNKRFPSCYPVVKNSSKKDLREVIADFCHGIICELGLDPMEGVNNGILAWNFAVEFDCEKELLSFFEGHREGDIYEFFVSFILEKRFRFPDDLREIEDYSVGKDGDFDLRCKEKKSRIILVDDFDNKVQRGERVLYNL